MTHVETNQCKGIDVKEFEEQRAKKQVLKAHFEQGLSSDPYILHKLANGSHFGSETGVRLGSIAKGFPPDKAMEDSELGSYKTRHETRMSAIDRPALPGKITNHENWPKVSDIPSNAGANNFSDGNESVEDLMDLGNPSITNNEPNTGARSSTTSKGKASIRPALTTHAASETPSWHAEQAGWKDGKYKGKAASVAGSNLTANYSDISEYDARKFFDPFAARYLCPAEHCDGQFETEKDFNNHLLTGSHVGGYAR